MPLTTGSPSLGAPFSLSADGAAMSSLIDPCALAVPVSVMLLPNIELERQKKVHGHR